MLYLETLKMSGYSMQNTFWQRLVNLLKITLLSLETMEISGYNMYKLRFWYRLANLSKTSKRMHFRKRTAYFYSNQTIPGHFGILVS